MPTHSPLDEQSGPLEFSRREFVSMSLAGAASAALGSVLASPAAAQPVVKTAGAQSDSTSLVSVDKRTPQLWRITIANPPFNLVVPEVVSALHAVVLEMDRDPDVRVVVLDSAIEGYFINHFDLARAQDFPMLPGDPAVPVWVDLVLRLSRSPVISIASIRGRTRGGGNEFALACDLRYASIEQAFFGQPEVGTGILPGGGASERLPRIAGRDRALEVILSSQDYGGVDAERLGMVTRALPDADLDAFVEALATRLATFDKQALAGAKVQVNRATLPPDADLHAAYAEYSQSLSWPGFKAQHSRMGRLAAEHGPSELENRLGYYIGQSRLK
ncbi:enoyl-CoA hydratase/isomerase family protein [Enterobacter ludwigii]|uniref:enoyl-CoA hydratase/isomerase family protein n=1 Tax=Enterobacter ludwigii TaxID=299767 RepID=UPI003975FBC1